MTSTSVLTKLSQQRIAEALIAVDKSPYATPHLQGLIDSAVMVIIHREIDDWHVLFTKRSASLPAHAGQVSFPGGRKDNTDIDYQATAIRETSEEIGIGSDYLNIAAELTPVCTLTGYRIYPYVCFIEELPELVAEVGEVDEIFSVPLEYLCTTNNLQQISRHYKGRDFLTFQIQWQSHNIWGATAHMLADLSHRIRTFGLMNES